MKKISTKAFLIIDISSILLNLGAGKKPKQAPDTKEQQEEAGSEYIDDIEEFSADDGVIYEESEEDMETADASAEDETVDAQEEYKKKKGQEEWVREDRKIADVEELPGVPPKEQDNPETQQLEDTYEKEYTKKKSAQGQIHKVWIWQETGDCLWNLAEKYYGDPWKWKLIYMANQDIIDDPAQIFPKQELIIPSDEW
ncbi:MAG: hypothetical protein ABII23_05695 [bacterium]